MASRTDEASSEIGVGHDAAMWTSAFTRSLPVPTSTRGYERPVSRLSPEVCSTDPDTDSAACRTTRRSERAEVSVLPRSVAERSTSQLVPVSAPAAALSTAATADDRGQIDEAVEVSPDNASDDGEEERKDERAHAADDSGDRKQ